MDKKEKKRHLIQAAWALLTNSYLIGFFRGRIYTGPLKNLCVPGLNCYSCPGALGSCPIGAFQAVIGSARYKAALYVSGFLIFIGALTGRFVCGFLCPFGLIQELLHKIPFPKKLRTFRGDRLLRKFKYAVFLVLALLLPMFVTDFLGQGSPWFCKVLCPAGTLEGGIPLVLLNQGLRGALGFLYAWKMGILIAILFLSVIIFRPFCKYLCPLGAVYSVFNPIAVFRYRLDQSKCVDCGACKSVCQMGLDPVKELNRAECIHCSRCKNACPTGAIRKGIRS